MLKGIKTIINNDYQRFKLFLKQVREIKTTALTNYYDSINWYYSLNDDEKILLETVISLGGGY